MCLRSLLFLFVCFLLFGGELSALDPSAEASPFSWKGWLTLFLVLGSFVLLVIEFFPPHVVMLLGALSFTLTGVISYQEFLQGFSRDIILTLIMLFIVATTLEINGLLNFLSKKVLPKSKNPTRCLASIMIPASISSAFMNNTPIVVMLTSTIRQWAVKNGLTPSKFLIPLSYAAIFGGSLTLIGSSTNLIVDSLMRAESAPSGLSFFELAKVGGPAALLGLFYMMFVGHYFLPKRVDPSTVLKGQTQEFISEFLVTKECPLKGITLAEAGKQFLHDALVIEIERSGRMKDSPSPEEILLEGDRLVIAGEVDSIASLHSVAGLQSLADPHFKLDLDAPHLSEVVVSITSSLIGKTLRQADFRNQYGASVVAIYRQGWRVPGSVGDSVLHAGDTLILLSSEVWRGGLVYPNDFYFVRQNEPLNRFVPWRALWVSAVMAAMVVAAVMGVPMLVSASAAAFAMVATGSIRLREAGNSIQWSLLFLIGSSFSYGMAMQGSGVATIAGKGIVTLFGTEPHFLIAGIFLATLLVTELITNNAAALILFPIALEAGKVAGYDSLSALKAIGVTVIMGANSSFLTPIGYQTNTIVYGPGGYRFLDYTKVGAPVSLLVMVLVVFLVPELWPLLSDS